MLDENEHSRKEDGRSLHRLLHKTEQQDATVEVDSAALDRKSTRLNSSHIL